MSSKIRKNDRKFKAISIDEAFGSADTDTLAGTGYVQDNSDFGASIKEQKRKYIEGRGPARKRHPRYVEFNGNDAP